MPRKPNEVGMAGSPDAWPGAAHSCPKCGLTLPAGAIRCPRCNALVLAGCTGSCGSCGLGGCAARSSD